MITIISSLIFVASVRAEEVATLPFINASLSPEQRAIDLVHRMTLQEKASQLVNQARAIPRLGVPAYDWWSEALHGVLAKGTTEFPQPVGLAATFDVPAIREMATAIGAEGRIKHVQAERDGHSSIFEGLDFWATNVNIFRDPRAVDALLSNRGLEGRNHSGPETARLIAWLGCEYNGRKD